MSAVRGQVAVRATARGRSSPPRLAMPAGCMMDFRPGLAEFADVDGLICDRLGAVVNQENKAGGEQHQTQ